MRTRSAACLLGAASVILSCGGDPAEPSPDPSIPVPIEIGDTVTVSVDSGTQGRLYLLRSDTAVYITVFLQSLSDYGAVIIKDSASGAWLGLGTSPPDTDPAHLLLSRTDVARVDPAKPLLIQAVSGWVQPRAARIRFHVRAVNPQPEVLNATLIVGDTLDGETLTTSADIDEFTLPVTAGEEFIAFLKTSPGAPATLPVRVKVYPPGAEDAVAEIGPGAPEADLEALSTGVFRMPATGLSRIVVAGTAKYVTSLTHLNGTYQLLVRSVNRAPESIGAVIAVNDTVEGERIDHVGDIDEFSAEVIAGEGYRLFLQTVDAVPGTTLKAALPHPHLQVMSLAGDTALVDRRTGIFVAPSSGPITITVTGEDAVIGFDRGGYRLFLYHINRLPEIAPATIVPGDSVLMETVEFPGDVDSFTVAPSPTGLVNYVLRHPGVSAPPVLGEVIATWPNPIYTQRSSLSCYPDGLDPGDCGSGTHAVPPEGAWLKVWEGQDSRGPYQIRTYAIDTSPEGTPAAIPVGQQVAGEIEPAGDADVYTVHVGADQLFEVEFDCSCVDLHYGFTNGVAGYVSPGFRSGRFAFADTGTQSLTVRGYYYGERAHERGSYQFTLRQLAIELETAPPIVNPPDTVTAESIDSLGDVDEFTVTGLPGLELLATITPVLRLEARQMATPDTLRTASNGAPGPIVIPAGGQFRLRVFETRTGEPFITNAFHFTGPYALKLRQLDRDPETVPPGLTRGMESRGESIDYIGDIDEYTFDGVAGDTVVVRLANPLSRDQIRPLLDFLSPTGAVLASITDLSGTPTYMPTVTLPVSGTYRIRVWNYLDFSGTGPYDVLVQ
jgi:hypothetical protein